jgi:hypothetical protein
VSTTLKKRWSLPASVIRHIFEGDINDGALSGFHSEAVKHFSDNVRTLAMQDAEQTRRRLSGQPYKMSVEVKIGETWYGPKVSTFFPHPDKTYKGCKFTKDNIVRWIEQALTKHSDKDRPDRASWTTNPRKMAKTDTGRDIVRIRIGGVPCHVLYQSGVGIASVYPSSLDDVDV